MEEGGGKRNDSARLGSVRFHSIIKVSGVVTVILRVSGLPRRQSSSSSSSSFRLLVGKSQPQRADIEATQLGLLDHHPRLALDRPVDHLAIQSPGTLAQLLRPLLRDRHSHRPLDLLRLRTEDPAHRTHLTRMDTLFATETHPLAVPALVLQLLVIDFGFVGRADEVDGRWEVGGARGGHDGAAGKEELFQIRGAGQGEIEGEVLGGEDQAGEEMRGRGGDLREGGQGAGGFDEGEDRDRLVLAGTGVSAHVGDEGEVAGRVDFGDDEGGEVAGLDHLVQVCEGEARRNGVDADGAFFDARGKGLVEGLADEGSCFLLAIRCDRVFEVLGHAVSG
jgi:hypothetical protein